MNAKLQAMLGALLAVTLHAGAQAAGEQLNEGFEGAGLPAGWQLANFSTNPAGEAWFKPLISADTFAAQSGAADSYLATSVFVAATDAQGNPFGRVDAILSTPTVSMEDTTVLRFWTRTVTDSAYGDSLKIGAIIAGSIVDLTTINPSFTAGTYPDAWKEYAVTLPGQGEGVTGRFFFEYAVPNAGVAGNFVALDSVTVSAVPEPETGLLYLAGFGALMALAARRRSAKASAVLPTP